MRARGFCASRRAFLLFAQGGARAGVGFVFREGLQQLQQARAPCVRLIQEQE